MAKQDTLESFILKARNKHKDKYSYDQVNYINSICKVKIQCNKCSEFFLQAPNKHIFGQGCPYCAKSNLPVQKRQELFIKQSIAAHGDVFSYEKLQYQFNNKKVCITCKKCRHDFWQLPFRHLKGIGCPYCRVYDNAVDPYAKGLIYKITCLVDYKIYIGLTTTTLAKRFENHFYDALIEQTNYPISQAIRTFGKEQFSIESIDECYAYQLPDRETFWIKELEADYPKGFNVNKGGAGLHFTYDVNQEQINLINIKDEKTKRWIIKAIKRHGDSFNYSLVNYTNGKLKVTLICKSCNYQFDQQAQSHIQGTGCPKCGRVKSDLGRYKSKAYFIEKSRKIHGYCYDYSLVGYVKAITKVKIICNVCKEIFEQTPNSHTGGTGCPKCSKTKIGKKLLAQLRGELWV